MKLRKAFSALLFGLGCAVSFVGTLALVLPAVKNSQMQLVLDSFEMPSSNVVVAIMNTAVSFALHNAWQVLAVGLFAALVGGILLAVCSRTPHPAPVQEELFRRPAPAPVPVQPVKQTVNPFAHITYEELPEPEPSAIARNVLHQEPLLDLNPIPEDHPAEPEVPSFQPPAAPVMSAQSQSGSRIITRTVLNRPDPIAAPSEMPKEEPLLKPTAEAAPVAEPTAPPQPSSRIRSTMGQHRKW